MATWASGAWVENLPYGRGWGPAAHDGGMIQKMARENATQRKFDIRTLMESIRAAVTTYGAGRISAGEGVGEIKKAPRTDPKLVRYAPAFSQNLTSDSESEVAEYPYTVQTLAGFLGSINPDGESLDSFNAAFGAVELIEEGYLTDARIKDLELFKISEVVKIVKQERTKALAEAKRLAEEAEERRKARLQFRGYPVGYFWMRASQLTSKRQIGLSGIG